MKKKKKKKDKSLIKWDKKKIIVFKDYGSRTKIPMLRIRKKRKRRRKRRGTNRRFC